MQKGAPEQHYTPAGTLLNLNEIAEECRRTIVDRNGFLEPTPELDEVVMNGAEFRIAMLFKYVMLPMCEGIEHIRKGRAEEAGTALKTAAAALMSAGQEVKYHPEQLTMESLESRETLIMSKLMLDATELAEVHNNGYDFRDFADIIIRIMTTAASMKVNLDAYMSAEMAHNNTREPKHGKLA